MTGDTYEPPVSELSEAEPSGYEPVSEHPQPGPAIPVVSPEDAAKLPRELPPRGRDIARRERARLARHLEKRAPARPHHADVPPTEAAPATRGAHQDD